MKFSRVWALALCIASLVAVGSCVIPAQAQIAATPIAQASALPIVGDPHDARGRNLVVLDSVVFILGVGVLGGVLIYWGRRIYLEK